MRSTLSALLVLGLAACGAPRSYVADPALRDRLQDAMVEVLADDRLEGSGCFVAADGLVLTAAHVLARPGRRLEVRSRVFGRLPARLVAVDRGHDLALLATSPAAPAPSVAIAADAPQLGDSVWLHGAPIFRHDLVCHGRVARAEPGFEWFRAPRSYVRCWFASGVGPSGTSGGPWLNDAGELVGVQSGSMMTGGSPAGIAFIVPADAARNLLATRRDAATATLGAALEEVWEQSVEYLGKLPPKTEGLVVRVLVNDGPLAGAAVELFDIITAIDGQPVRLRDELVAAVRRRPPRTEIELQVLTPGSPRRTVLVTLASLESGWQPRGKR